MLKRIMSFVSLFLISLNALASNDQNNLPTQQFMINGSIYQIEIAHSRQQLQQGLMRRDFLAPKQGMLFVFPKYQRHGIWMKNMLIPLTVAWLDKRLTVIAVQKMMPCQHKNCPVAKPNNPSAYVLELSFENTIAVGDAIKRILIK